MGRINGLPACAGYGSLASRLRRRRRRRYHLAAIAMKSNTNKLPRSSPRCPETTDKRAQAGRRLGTATYCKYRRRRCQGDNSHRHRHQRTLSCQRSSCSQARTSVDANQASLASTTRAVSKYRSARCRSRGAPPRPRKCR
jgi:hypothetical protein